MHQKLLTIKDTLLSSQTSHPPQQSPHKPCRNHHKATRPTLPHQPRNHKTTIPEPASRTSQQNQPTTPPPKQQPGKPYRNPPPPSNPTRKHPKHSHHQEPHTQPPTAQHTLHTPTTNTNPHPPTGNTPSQKAFTGSHATSLVLTDPGPLADLPANSSLLHPLSRGFLAPPKPATFEQHVDNVSTPPG